MLEVWEGLSEYFGDNEDLHDIEQGLDEHFKDEGPDGGVSAYIGEGYPFFNHPSAVHLPWENEIPQLAGG